jgi:NAD(P)-dependent dehydrogenase (short-subunit alcohol dehydrogenase family)
VDVSPFPRPLRIFCLRVCVCVCVCVVVVIGMSDSATPTKPLIGKKAVVTGGNKGIGEAISLALAEKGADIAIIARDTDSAQNVIKKVRSERRFCKVYPADLNDSACVRKAAKEILEDMGRVDILVNNAGMSQLESLLDFSEDNWDRTMNVNLKAPFLLSQEFAKGMIERKSGKIIHISSVAAVQAVDEHAAYCVSKAGLHMLTKMMALEWGPYNIQTNAIAPTVVWTEMGQRVWGAPEKHEPMLARIPAHRFVKPEEVAELTVFLAGPGSDMICGQVSFCVCGCPKKGN